MAIINPGVVEIYVRESDGKVNRVSYAPCRLGISMRPEVITFILMKDDEPNGIIKIDTQHSDILEVCFEDKILFKRPEPVTPKTTAYRLIEKELEALQVKTKDLYASIRNHEENISAKRLELNIHVQEVSHLKRSLEALSNAGLSDVAEEGNNA